MKTKSARLLALVMAMVWLIPILSSYSRSVEQSVTPDSLDQQGYVFSVLSWATNDGVAFQVTITAKSRIIYSDSNASLQIVKHFNNNGTSIEPANVAKTTLETSDHVWKANFTVPRKSLKTPGLCFIFKERSHATINGKFMAMTSSIFFEMRLLDFVKS